MVRNRIVISFVFFLLIFISTTAFGQSLKELTAQNQKVFLMVSNPDSVSNFYETSFSYLQKNGYWKISDSISDADFVLVLTGFNIKLNGYPHFECYSKIYDKEMNFIYRGDFLWKSGTIWDTYDIFFTRTIKSIINSLPKELSSAKPSKTSVYEAATKVKEYKLSNKKKNEFDRNIEQAYEAINYKQSSKAIGYLTKCIKILPDRYDLYKLRAFLNLEMDHGKGAMSDLKIYMENIPTDPDIDAYWQMARYQRSERNEKMVRNWTAVTAGLQVVNTALIQMNNNTNTTIKPTAGPSNTNQKVHSSTSKLGCAACNSSMENSNFNFRTMKGDGKCWSCDSSGRKKSCVGISKRGVAEFGLSGKCDDSDCIKNNHKCKDCGGTNVCPKCKGTGYD